ncbi:hypothetical protein LUZ60_016842 [Juncus effusus]|nr:hypothetical protein LUZ60_016842 [Juncus effusus]
MASLTTLLPTPPLSLRPTISSVSFLLARVSISAAARPRAAQPLVMRSRKWSVRAGEAGEEEESTGDAAVATLEQEEEEKVPAKRKPFVKFGDVIGILNQRQIEEAEKIKPVPDIRPGDIVEIKKQKANRKRLALYKGIVISKSSAGIHTTIRIRYMTAGTAVEIVFPVYSPTIKEIKVVSHRDVRRAKLYYLRDMLPRFYTFKKNK